MKLRPAQLILTAIVLFLLSALAQTGTPPPTHVSENPASPPSGDPAVFVMFLHYQAQVRSDLQKMAEANPNSAPGLVARAAASLNLTAADFEKINPIYEQLQIALRPIDTEADAYRDAVMSGRQIHDSAVIRQLHARRVQAIVDARVKLQHALTPAGWTALMAYIEGPFRRSIVRRQAGR